MKRHARTRILIESEPMLAEELAGEITATYLVRELVAPRQGMTMMKMRETAKRSLFYMGEVLMTEAMVEINGSVGIGMITGIEEERARHLAIIDAAYEANLPETTDWANRLINAEKELMQKQARKHAQLMRTKVSFETMDV